MLFEHLFSHFLIFYIVKVDSHWEITFKKNLHEREIQPNKTQKKTSNFYFRRKFLKFDRLQNCGHVPTTKKIYAKWGGHKQLADIFSSGKPPTSGGVHSDAIEVLRRELRLVERPETRD